MLACAQVLLYHSISEDHTQGGTDVLKRFTFLSKGNTTVSIAQSKQYACSLNKSILHTLGKSYAACVKYVFMEILHGLLTSIQGYYQPGWFPMSISVEVLGHSDNININPNPYEEKPVVKNSLGKLSPSIRA